MPSIFAPGSCVVPIIPPPSCGCADDAGRVGPTYLPVGGVVLLLSDLPPLSGRAAPQRGGAVLVRRLGAAVAEHLAGVRRLPAGLP